MSLHFYTEKENIQNKLSINHYKNIFSEYSKRIPNLNEALKEMFISTGITDQKAYELTEDILTKSEKFVEYNYDSIKDKYPALFREEAKIIFSYNCESKDPNYSPYKILNKNLCLENTEQGIKNISKYFFIFLKSLRKLERYFPNQKYMYRCVNKNIKLNDNYFDKKIEPYIRGAVKTFWGFTSISSNLNKKYNLKEKENEIKEGTVFTLYGNYWGYDISLFNSRMEEEIILEPEFSYLIRNAVPPSKNGIINIRCEIKNSPTFLDDLIRFDGIRLKYKLNEENNKKIKIFGNKFVENNKNRCKFIFQEKIYELQEYLNISNLKSKNLEIILIGIENIKDMSYMFYECTSFLSSPNFSKWDTSSVINMSYMFYKCNSLISLPDISKWNTSNVYNMSYMFYECFSLKTLPDISNWDTSFTTNIRFIFCNCSSLEVLPDISKWNTFVMNDMTSIFEGCISLKNLPDISKWNTSKLVYMKSMFFQCKSLKFLPNISNWDTSSVIDMSYLFYKCSSLLSLPNISKWKTFNVENMSNMFYECTSLSFLPDISKWNTSNVKNMSYMFCKCSSLSLLPDITKWNISSVNQMNLMFYKCLSLSYFPKFKNIFYKIKNNDIKNIFDDEINYINNIFK